MSERSRYAAYDMPVKEGGDIRNFFQIMLTYPINFVAFALPH